MKMKTLELLRNLQHRLSRSRRWLFVAVITLCLDSLEHASSTESETFCCCFHTITSTLQGPIGEH